MDLERCRGDLGSVRAKLQSTLMQSKSELYKSNRMLVSSPYQQLFRAESREQRRYHPYKQRQRACYNWEDDAVSTTTATWLRVPEPDVDEEKEVV